jgi:hypothetical protein
MVNTTAVSIHKIRFITRFSLLLGRGRRTRGGSLDYMMFWSAYCGREAVEILCSATPSPVKRAKRVEDGCRYVNIGNYFTSAAGPRESDPPHCLAAQAGKKKRRFLQAAFLSARFFRKPVI